MLNYIWLGFLLSAVLLAGFNGRLAEVNTSAIDGANRRPFRLRGK